jgi:EAL domain-containing protein (putative c-di-GMP-specific phosphodiesterase class I)
MNAKRETSAIIRAVTTLAGALSVPVCVEGIENEATYEAVIALGCAIGQGWYFGKPMRADQVRELLAGRERSEEPPASTAVNG